MANVLRFVEKAKRGQGTNRYGRFVSPREIKAATRALVRDAQRTNPIQEEHRKQLGLYEDNEGLVRCKGRLSETTDISEEAAHPLYLSRKSPLVNLIIMDIHLKRRHCGSNTLVSEFRQEFWSPQLGRSVR